MRNLLFTILFSFFLAASVSVKDVHAFELPEGATQKGATTLTLSGTKPENLILSVTTTFIPMTKPFTKSHNQEIFTKGSDTYSITIPMQLFHSDMQYRLLNIRVRATVKHTKETVGQDLRSAGNVFTLSFLSEKSFEEYPLFREKGGFPDFPAELDLMCVENIFFMGKDLGNGSIIDCDYEGKDGQISRLPLTSVNKDARMTLNFILTGQNNLNETAR